MNPFAATYWQEPERRSLFSLVLCENILIHCKSAQTPGFFDGNSNIFLENPFSILPSHLLWLESGNFKKKNNAAYRYG